MDTCSMVTPAGPGGPRDLPRAAARALIVFLFALAPAVLPALAYASPPDPSWISGIWNGADGDDVVALVLSAVKGIAAAVIGHAWLTPRLIGRVAARGRDVLQAPTRAGIRSRAPPLAS